MKTRRIKGTSLEASSLCLGTANWGANGEDAARRVYDRFRSAGGNFFDCAHIYACWRNQLGLPERLLGEFIKSEKRSDFVIASKGGHPNFKGYPKPDSYLSAQSIRSDIDQSLERLQIDSLDIFYLHRDDVRLSVEEIMDTLASEVARGVVKYLGASNWTIERIDAANAYAKRTGKPMFQISQPMWNLGFISAVGGDASMTSLNDRVADLDYHANQQLPVACYTPTAQGYFADNGRMPKRYDNEISRGRLDRCKSLATRLGKTSGQIALVWLMNQPFEVYPVLGTQSLEHLDDALGAAGIVIDEKTRHWIANG